MEAVVDDVAQQYLENTTIKAEYIAARCPFHGPDRNPSFWMERATGKFGCWACGASGSSLLWFLKDMGARTRDIEHTIKEAEKDRFHRAKIAKRQKERATRASFLGEHTLPENILGLWDLCPEALLEAGFEEKILRDHDVGFDEKRMRITFPIRDIEGSLVGISGRSVDGSNPKYKVYQGRHQRVDYNGKPVQSLGELGEWFPSYSSTDIRNHLYRGHAVYDPCFFGKVPKESKVIVVEGYKAALWLVQLGYPLTVALMGARMSATQERLIKRMGVPTYILLDNNDAGQSGMDFIASKLGRCSFPVYRCFYPEDRSADTQPDDLTTAEEVEEILQTAPRAVSKMKRKTAWRR